MSNFLLLVFGFLTGIKHALDTDHLAAVSSLVTRTRKVSSAVWAGAWWGLGHTVTLMLAGIIIVAFEVSIPHKLALSLEMVVGLMLMVLGVINLRVGYLDKFHLHQHEHDRHRHFHLHAHKEGETPHDHSHSHTRSRARAFAVGIVHGLAGSAALTLLILTTVKSVPLGMLYIGLFGIGSILGMGLFALMLGLPAAAISQRFSGFNRLLTMGTGVFSLTIGLLLVKGTGAGLF